MIKIGLFGPLVNECEVVGCNISNMADSCLTTFLNTKNITHVIEHFDNF